MGKSPGKWIKAVLSGKKSSKSNLSKVSKDATFDKKTSITINTQSKNLDADPTVISSPVPPDNNPSKEHTQLKNSTPDNARSTIGLDAANGDELIKLEQAATKAQAAFRGYLARRAFWALRGIIRLQALIRGHLVRRQAVATLHCMRAIVEFQALVRGRTIRLSGTHFHKKLPEEYLHKERVDLLQTSLKSEKLSTNAFGVKLVASSKTKMPLSIHYDSTESNSAMNWLERWSTSHFWDPLSSSKNTLDVKPKRKQKSKVEKPKRDTSKVSVSAPGASGKLELANKKLLVTKLVDVNPSVDLPPVEIKVKNEGFINMESNGKENMKTRRRKSFPVKQEYAESVSSTTTATLPSYMAATESAKAKLRAQAAARAVGLAEDGAENGFVRRRHSLPASTTTSTAGKLSLQSPRVQKPLQVNVKGGTKTNKPQNSPRDVSQGWRR